MTSSNDLTIDDWIVCWTPAGQRFSPAQVPGGVLVASRGDKADWSERYANVTGGCGIEPQAAHREFLKIDEYRKRISPDIGGAVSGGSADG